MRIGSDRLKTMPGMFRIRGRGGSRACFAPAVVCLSAWLAGCGPPTVEDPIATLSDRAAGRDRHEMAMSKLAELEDPDEAARALDDLIWRPGYSPEVREEALARLEAMDVERLKRTIRQQLPRMEMFDWLTRLSELVAERGWVELTPALVSSWSRPAMDVKDEDRPERAALAKLHGEDQVIDAVYATFFDAQKPSQQMLRTRCWELLHRLGERERLIELVAQTTPDDRDAMLLDLNAAAKDFGLVPLNREEILWVRKLREAERAEFWSEAAGAVQLLSEERRRDLELRTLPVVVAAARHDPDMLTQSTAQLIRRLERSLDGERHYGYSGSRTIAGGRRMNTVAAWRDELTWGDAAAMLMARRALDVPQVRDHLFDYAERDRRDESTEYGGVIDLDEQGRFEVLEFIPRIRQHDQKFIASQAMMDAGYAALFHFHLHCQSHRNRRFAGPGMGDADYAEALRSNCLVFTFVNRDRMNVDYYRYGGVVIDLGTIERPQLAGRTE